MMLARRVLQNKQASTGLLAGAVVAGAAAYALYSYSSAGGTKAGQARATFGSGPSFTSLRLHRVESVNHNTKKFTFELPDANDVSGLGLTSALLTLSRPDGHFFPVIRPYTPTSDLDCPGFIELLVKRYPNGKASTHIHSLTPGQHLLFLAPLKGYAWTPNRHARITLIAGGQGITPMYQLIRAILKDPAERTRITVIFGVNSDADVLFEDEFRDYATRFPARFRVVYAVSGEAPGPRAGREKGHVTKELIEKVVGRDGGMVFVCGPPAMEKALTGRGGILAQLGYGKDRVHTF